MTGPRPGDGHLDTRRGVAEPPPEQTTQQIDRTGAGYRQGTLGENHGVPGDNHGAYGDNHGAYGDNRGTVGPDTGAEVHRGDPDTGRHGTGERPRPTHRDVVAGQQERFGGTKWGSAFFGWLTAVGTAVLLTALVVAIGAVFDLDWAAQADEAARTPGSFTPASITGAVITAVVLLLAYYSGGYVAGRMARFSGARQGVAVWVWTIVIGVVAAIVVAASDVDLRVPAGVPALPVDQDALTLGGVVAGVAALVIALVGAVLGGLAGMRFHRKVDALTVEEPIA
ncbi:hypothetical protein [Actinokineospora bangkokensis]|nr:hypothetical protein [Actinokineospora bangkokensis]